MVQFGPKLLLREQRNIEDGPPVGREYDRRGGLDLLWKSMVVPETAHDFARREYGALQPQEIYMRLRSRKVLVL